MLLDEDKPEAARGALELLRPDIERQRIETVAFGLLSSGGLTGDRAVSLWTEAWRSYLLEKRLRNEIDAAR